MKLLLLTIISAFISTSCARVESRPADTNETMSTASFYDFTMNSIDGKEINFSQFKGKKVLIVNTASKCGYTPQYEGLQELHEKYGDKLTIIGFPANDFGGQEPGSNEEIQGFCSKNYGVTFQMMEKISVSGGDMPPLYKWLTQINLNGWNEEAPSWNFCKYLISEDGKLLNFFNSSVKPMSDPIVKAI
ncbi:MAG: glutathione peroxidase [Bacteroidia bacterium]